MRTFHLGKQRFWNIDRQKKSVVVSYGTVGGKTTTRKMGTRNEEDTFRRFRQAIKQKLADGYAETTPSLWPLASPTGRALEDALAENPDDLAAHMAYADWLSEQPERSLQVRAEFIRVQLTLEDEKLPAGERKKLQKREKELLRDHERDWLGPALADFFVDRRNDDMDFTPGRFFARARWTFRRGWLDSVDVDDLTSGLSRALARSPGARLLRKLVVEDSGINADGFAPLIAAPASRNLRHVEIQGFCEEGKLVPFLAGLPSVEEMHLAAYGLEPKALFRSDNLGHLHTLVLADAEEFPLKDIAGNPRLGRLRTLRLEPEPLDDYDEACHLPLKMIRHLFGSPHLTSLRELTIHRTDMGDEGVRALVAANWLKRLTVLDLAHGCITDAGARVLVESPDFGHLKKLDLTENRLTREGIRLLKRSGLELVTADQQRPNDMGEYNDAYLYHEDYLEYGEYDDDWE